MTIHNSKLKEFEEIFIYQGHHQGRIVRPNASANEVAKYVWYSESQLLGRRYGLQSSRPGLMCVGFSNPDMYPLERIVSKIKQLLRTLQARTPAATDATRRHRYRRHRLQPWCPSRDRWVAFQPYSRQGLRRQHH